MKNAVLFSQVATRREPSANSFRVRLISGSLCAKKEFFGWLSSERQPNILFSFGSFSYKENEHEKMKSFLFSGKFSLITSF
ncbi:MAG: hypothetical protein ACTTJH_00715 [Bacteroidales bacterium]